MHLRRTARPGSATAAPVVAVAGWAALVLVAVVWGHAIRSHGDLNVQAPPFQGLYRLALSSVLPATVFAAGVIAIVPPLARHLPWRWLLVLSWLSACSWAVLLNGWDGHHTLASTLGRRHEYLAVLPAVGDDPLGWLRGFTSHLGSYPVHVKGHPPLMVLVFWAWDHVGLTGRGWAAALVVGVGASAVVAIAVAVRAAVDEFSARAALPFLVLAPFAITVATSADAFFLGVGAWAAAALAVGVRRGTPLPLAAGGLLAGALPYLSYGLLALGAVLLVVTTSSLRRPGAARLSWAGALATAGGLLAVPALMTLAGFSWPAGVAATHEQWRAGLGDDRPYGYSLVADLAVLAVLVGPATAAAAVSRPRRGLMTIAGAALVAVLILDVSGVTRLEVERIWLPFAPWLVVVCAALRTHGRRWMAVNAAAALLFQAVVLDVW